MKTLERSLFFAGWLFAATGAGLALASTTATVTQVDKAFAEKEISVGRGATVHFVNNDSVKHNILIKKLDFNSGLQSPGDSVAVTFDKSGKFKVRCGIHPKMKMKVVVN